ncbi:MAG: S8 family serine peptidase [Microbacterium sp.]|uniref:S8 family serine peptidase n=1 Tax=Microbacterium sp. TaxID=51671 RepID=UPI003F9AB230
MSRAARRGRAALLPVIALAAGMLAVPLAAPDEAHAADSCAAEDAAYTTEVPAALALVDAAGANALATGDGVVVAIVDSGIDVGNPHLRGVQISGVNLVGDGERVDGLSDLTGHGTAIAGIIASQPVEGSGVVGLAPDVELMSVRVFRSDSDQDAEAGFGPSAQKIADGIRYAADHGADVINVSLSQESDSSELRAAVEHAAAAGALVVASAGNRKADEDAPDAARYPAGYAQALGVTAADDAGRATDASVHGPQVDVAAPGQDVLTIAANGKDCLYAAEAPASSYATGYASAAAALVVETHPEDSAASIAYRLMATALRDNADARDDVNGWGFIQPAAAITLLPDRSTRGPVSPYFDTAGSTIAQPEVALETDSTPSGFLLTRETAVFIALGAATLLGVLGILIVRRRRLAEAKEPAVEARAGGLFTDEA